MLKMRELNTNRQVRVKHIPTADNPADMFTKYLDNQTFARHRATVMNLAAHVPYRPAPANESES